MWPRDTATQTLSRSGLDKIEGIPEGFNMYRAKMVPTKYGLLLVEPDSKPLIIRDGVARELEV